jgi:hypothetical protein
VLAAVILGESRGSLVTPGGLLSAAGRFAGFGGTYFQPVIAEAGVVRGIRPGC